MKTTTITLNEFNFVASYELTEAEPSDYEYAGTQPMVRLWMVETLKGENITDTLTELEWHDIEDQIYTHHEL